MNVCRSFCQVSVNVYGGVFCKTLAVHCKTIRSSKCVCKNEPRRAILRRGLGGGGVIDVDLEKIDVVG